ncbi:MAG: hypothetical protein AAF672_09235, partial [Pseudomonadota bacterium]
MIAAATPTVAAFADPLPDRHTAGLLGQIYVSDDQIRSIADARALMTSDADGTFIATQLEYGAETNGKNDPLADVLGADAASLSPDADADRQFDNTALALTGKIWLEAG